MKYIDMKWISYKWSCFGILLMCLKPFIAQALEVKQDLALDAVTRAVQELSLTERERSLYQKEVIPYPVFFMASSGRVDSQRLRFYLKFSSRGLMEEEEEGRRAFPLCYMIRSTDPACKHCDETKTGLEKYLTQRLKQRGFDPREYIPNEFVANASAPMARGADLYLGRAVDAECPHIFYGEISPNPNSADSLQVQFVMEVQDAGKRRHRSEAKIVALLESKETNPRSKNPFGPVTTALGKGTEVLFTKLGEDTIALQQKDEGPEKKIRLENVKSFSSYMAFKNKIVSTVEGVRALEERIMEPGVVEFIVRGEINLSDLVKRLNGILGDEPAIGVHEVQADTLRVVLR